MFDSIHKSKPKQMLKGIHGLLNDADAVISYNGRKFDLPILHKEFLLYNFNPPQPYKQIDLLNTMRQRFKFVSNKLDYVCQQLGLGKKADHEGFELWLKCMANDKEAWKRMEKYNKQDVVLLESLYNRVLPWIKNHPNMNLHQDHEGCPTCGATQLQKRGTSISGTGTYQRYQCRSCGTWSQGTKSLKPSVTVKGIA
jgi:DNA polymerase III epsilon subunit-like protein